MLMVCIGETKDLILVLSPIIKLGFDVNKLILAFFFKIFSNILTIFDKLTISSPQTLKTFDFFYISFN